MVTPKCFLIEETRRPLQRRHWIFKHTRHQCFSTAGPRPVRFSWNLSF